jgi:Uma2 family endonuclease
VDRVAADPVGAIHGTGLLTAADLAFEPDDGLRRELYDGVMHVVPPPGDTHSWQVLALYRLLYATAPGDVFVLHDVGVHVGLRRLFVPDLTVVYRTTPFHDNGFDPGGVLLVVECLSPGSVTMDRIAKPAVYAEQGISFFWRVDDGPCLQTYRLDPHTGVYGGKIELGPGEVGEPASPWPVRVDMKELVMPGRS